MRTDLKKYWVSTVELVGYPVETYETMVFRSFDDFDEVEAHRTNNETEAMQNHRRMVAKYCDNKVQKLRLIFGFNGILILRMTQKI